VCEERCVRCVSFFGEGGERCVRCVSFLGRAACARCCFWCMYITRVQPATCRIETEAMLLCYLCYLWSELSCELFFCSCYLCAISVLSLLSPAISVLSLCYLCAISVLSLCYLCVIFVLSLWHLYVISKKMNFICSFTCFLGG